MTRPEDGALNENALRWRSWGRGSPLLHPAIAAAAGQHPPTDPAK